MSSSRKLFHAREAVRSIFYAPYLATIQAGFLEKEGLEGTLGVVPPGGDSFKMLDTGEIQIVQNAPSASFSRLEQGQKNIPFQVAGINDRDGFYIVSRKPLERFQWKSLEGATVVPASFGVQPWACLMFCLSRQGVNTDRVKLVTGLKSMQEAEDAFRKGTGDYVHLQNPNALRVVEDGVGYLATSVGEALGPIAFSSLAMSRKFLAKEPEAAEAFMRAYIAARKWVRTTDAESVVDALQPLFPGTAKRVLVESIRDYRRINAWPESPLIPRESYERALDMWFHAKQITKRYPYEDVVATALIEKVTGKAR
jgi:NitT/TauT family transport system substrate-binding protein